MARYVVGTVSEIPPGERKIIQAGNRTIGVFNVGGAFYALRNTCPHQGAPLCKGHVTGTTLPSQPGEYIWAKEGEILRCPWHGWEFDITNGRSVFNPHKLRVKTYEVTVEPGVTRTVAADEEDPSVETFPVTVEDEVVILHA